MKQSFFLKQFFMKPAFGILWSDIGDAPFKYGLPWRHSRPLSPKGVPQCCVLPLYSNPKINSQSYPFVVCNT